MKIGSIQWQVEKSGFEVFVSTDQLYSQTDEAMMLQHFQAHHEFIMLHNNGVYEFAQQWGDSFFHKFIDWIDNTLAHWGI